MANILFFICPTLPTPYRAVDFNISYILSSNKKLKKKKNELKLACPGGVVTLTE